jgi:hypothetical protein
MRDFLENRNVIGTGASKAQPESAGPLLHHILRTGHTQDQEFPKLELKNDAEGKLREIVVTCHCGERIVLQCTY